jgi:hypothetical protein
MKVRKILLLGFLMALLLVLLSGCVPGDGSITAAKPAGFFSGIWHGWIAPFSLIYSLFNGNIHIYEVYNTGFWYDLGYYMAIISGFGGLALSRRNRKSKKDSDDNN